MQGEPSWISNSFKKKRHFFRNPREIFVGSLVTKHAVVLKKKLKIVKSLAIRNPRWLPLHLILAEAFSTSSPELLHVKSPDLPEMFL
jgi:hypothetical protein